MRLETAVALFVNASFALMVGGASFVAASVIFP